MYLQDAQGFLYHAIFLRADGHLWSIPQELTFDLALPLLVIGSQWAFSNRAGHAACALMLLAALAFSPAGALLTNLPGGAYGEVRFMLGNFLAGMVGAYTLVWLGEQRIHPEGQIFGRLVGILGVVGIIVLITKSP